MTFRIVVAAALISSAVSFTACTKSESNAAPAEQPPVASATVPSRSAEAVQAQAAAPPASSPAPAPAPASQPLATADGETSGVRAEVTELRRSSGGTVNLKFTVINDSSEQLTFGYNFVEKNKGYADIGGVHLIDQEGKKKYFVARDSEGNCVCSRDQKDLPAGQRRNLWAKFPAPPADVKRISVVIPHFSPMDDVPVSD